MKNTSPEHPPRFRFEKLDVWQDARRLNRETCGLTQVFPVEELPALTSQARRAAVSISANIAEGSGCNSDRDFARFLGQSYGSAMELASHLYLARDLGYLSVQSLESALDHVHHLAIRIAALNRSLGVGASKVRLARPSTLDSRPSTS
ncbi:MAG: four helix bundle protein [Opitutaceae bacterium]